MNRKSTKLISDFLESLAKATYAGNLRWRVSRNESDLQGDKTKKYIVRAYKVYSSTYDIILKLKQYSKLVLENNYKVYDTDIELNVDGDVIKIRDTNTLLQHNIMTLCAYLDRMYDGYQFSQRTVNTMMIIIDAIGYPIDDTNEHNEY